MNPIMLIELWERLRGYDKWIETKAKVRSSTEQKTEQYYRGRKYEIRSSDDGLAWTDTQGVEHSANFDVPEDSPLYQLIGGESVTIRYDPQDPNRFYYPDLLSSKVKVFAHSAYLLLLLVILLVVPAVLFRFTFGPRH